MAYVITIPPFPKMGGHGADPDNCAEKLGRTFGPKVTERTFRTPQDLVDEYWPEGLVITIINDKGKITVKDNCEELNKMKKKMK